MSDALLGAKLALERELERPLAHMMIGYIAAKQNGLSLFERTSWAAQLQHVLANHYARVVMVVTGRRPGYRTTIEAASLSAEHAASLRRRSGSQANLILSSIDREWDRTPEAKKDVEDVPEDARGLYSRLTAKAREVWSRVKARFGAITSGQTNAPAEEARVIAARQMAGNRPLHKRWSTMLDERVRDAHREAEGQERHESEAFTVGGEQLMFPGDQSLGASLGAVINCRCSAVYFAVNPDGTRQDLAATPRLTPVAPNRAVGSVNHPSLITRDVQFRTGMTGGMIERVFLSDMLEARITVRDGIIRVTRAGRRLAIGRYTHSMRTGARVDGLVITSEGEGLGIPELIERSLARTNGR